jgi:hypothetical protein
MASYVPQTAITYCGSILKGMPFSTDIGVKVADSITQMLWMAAPWRWTLGSIDPAITVVASTSDYTFTKPSDFLYLVRPYIWNGKQANALTVESYLAVTQGNLGLPARIAHIPGSPDKLRLFPTPGGDNTTRTLISLYKKNYTPITSLNISTAGALNIPDEWAHVFEAGCLWLAMVYGDDDRAGTCQTFGDGKRQYTGQHGTFQALLQEMRESEKSFLQEPVGEQIRG